MRYIYTEVNEAASSHAANVANSTCHLFIDNIITHDKWIIHEAALILNVARYTSGCSHCLCEWYSYIADALASWNWFSPMLPLSTRLYPCWDKQDQLYIHTQIKRSLVNKRSRSPVNDKSRSLGGEGVRGSNTWGRQFPSNSCTSAINGWAYNSTWWPQALIKQQ